MDVHSSRVLADLFHSSIENNKSLNDGPVITENISGEIFSSCVKQHAGFALVSDLIDFLKPFLQEHLNALGDLILTLDPEGENPLIGCRMFHEAMTKWSKKLANSHSSPKSAGVSESRSNIGRYQIQTFFDSLLMNSSNFSGRSCNASSVDGAFYHERIHDLKNENRKLAELVSGERHKLNCAEEQRDMLLTELKVGGEKLTDKISHTDQLRSERKTEEDRKEALHLASLKIRQLEENVTSTSKSNESMLLQKDKLCGEIQQLNLKVADTAKSNENYKAVILTLNTNLKIKGKEIAMKQNEKMILQQKLTDQKKVIEQTYNERRLLEAKKKALEKALKQYIDKENYVKSNSLCEHPRVAACARRSSLTLVKPNPSSATRKFDESRNYDVAIDRIRQSGKNFNSPRLLKMLEESISPDMDSPPILYIMERSAERLQESHE